MTQLQLRDYQQQLIGVKFNSWVVIGEKTGRKVRCKCVCGKVKDVDLYTIKTGKSKSCGCIGNRKHGDHKTRLYSIWRNMKNRCKNKKSRKSHLYYDKGITYTNEWEDYENFKEWALNNGYQDGLTLDRIDGNGNYEPKNCRWTTPVGQANNTKANSWIEYKGVRKTKAQWARYANLKYNTFTERLRRGWSFERALFTPVKKEGGHK